MIESLYKMLGGLGFTHPLHPVGVHLPLGLIMGGFIFSLLSVLLKQTALARTARHVFVLALVSLPPVALGGYMDWQHFYGGAPLFPIKMKIFLACILFLLLSGAVYCDLRQFGNLIVLHAFCLMIAGYIGFYGGELVYGTKEPAPKAAPTSRGAELFGGFCAPCHYPDSTETKIGPGLKGLFQMQRLPVSQEPVSEAAVRNQFTTPFEDMPVMDELSEDEITLVVDYLKTL